MWSLPTTHSYWTGTARPSHFLGQLAISRVERPNGAFDGSAPSNCFAIYIPTSSLLQSLEIFLLLSLEVQSSHNIINLYQKRLIATYSIMGTFVYLDRPIAVMVMIIKNPQDTVLVKDILSYHNCMFTEHIKTKDRSAILPHQRSVSMSLRLRCAKSCFMNVTHTCENEFMMERWRYQSADLYHVLCSPVVILSDQNKEELDAELRQSLRGYDLEWHTRQGAPHSIIDLNRVAAGQAKSVVLLNPDGETEVHPL